MSEVTRAALFVLWLVVVSIACLDYAMPPRSVFGSMVLPLVFLPFISRRQFVDPIPRRDLWVVVAILTAFIVLIAWGILSGSNKASAEWFGHSELPAVFASVLWLSLMTLGISRFHAKRFLR